MITVVFFIIALIVIGVILYLGYKVDFTNRWILYCVASLMLTLDLSYVNVSFSLFEFSINSILSLSALFMIFVLIRNVYLYKFFDAFLSIVIALPLILKYRLKLDYFSRDCFLTIFQTNIEEAVHYVLGEITKWDYLLIVIILFCLFFINKKSISLTKKLTSKIVLLLVSAIIISISFSSSIFFIRQYKHEYEWKVAYLKRNVNADYSQFTPCMKDSMTCIVVIGESLCRDYMSAYGYSSETTPYLDKLLKDSSIIKFSNVYSSDIFTVNCVPRILSSENQFMNNIDYLLPSLLKANQFKFFWLSNQNEGGFHDNPVSTLAEKADVKIFRKGNSYDEVLLPLLQDAISDTSPRKLIILHLMGSHAPASSYYPNNVKYTKSKNSDDEVLFHYENSIIYNDHIMDLIYEKIDSLNNTMLFYTSDHGDRPGVARLPQNFDFQMCRIPFLVYFSPNLRTIKEYDILKSHQQKYWSNDLIFNLICGILDITHKDILPLEWDLSSSEYNLEKKDFGLSYLSFKISDDPYDFPDDKN